MTDVPIGDGLQPVVASEPSLRRVMGPWLLLLFIVGDILGTGIYALTGQVAKQVGGAVWLPFLLAFVVALITALSYLELVTKYPQAAGAALYTHKAFGIHFVTFIVAFAVMCSGITSASTASRAFAANMSNAFSLGLGGGIGITLPGLGFMAVVALVNFRGVGESVKANVVLTCVELSGLLIIIFIGLWAIGAGAGDVSRVLEFRTSGTGSMLWPVIAATTLRVLDLVQDGDELRTRLGDNTQYFRHRMTHAGFEIVPGEHAIVPVMLGDAALAARFAERLLDHGVYVIGFSFPVVPMGKARIRTQMCAGHDRGQLDRAIEAFIATGRELGVTG